MFALLLALLIPFCPTGSQIVAECDMASYEACEPAGIDIYQVDYDDRAVLPYQVHWRVVSRDLLITRHVAFSPLQIGEVRDVRPWARPFREYISGREYGIAGGEGEIASVIWCGRPGYLTFIPTMGFQ